jgi:hypothetical protein
MSLLSSILGPDFLVRKIPLISIILGGVVLALFSRYLNEKIIFPIADSLKEKAGYRMNRAMGKGKSSKYIGEFVATFIFILYCYFSTSFLADYFFSPVLYAFRNWLVLVLAVIFFLISVATNSNYVREKFM